MVIRVGFGGWSAWIVYVLVGTMQLLLIAMGIIFAVKGREDAGEGKADHRIAVPAHFAGWNSTRSRALSTASHTTPNVAPDERSSLLPRMRTAQTH